jgi:NADH-quinone oxidoreductase subunit C
MQNLTASIPGLEEVASADGMPTAYVSREQLVDAGRALRDAGFSVLLDVIPVDLFPREPRFELSYLLLNPGGDGGTAARFRMKVRVPGTEPTLPTLSGVWTSANWAEREAFDLFGILFVDHPDPRRILMPEDWEGYPMRKDYPVQIKTPVKTYEALQLTQEEFVANVEAARDRGRPD